jgi:hypothetical protein
MFLIAVIMRHDLEEIVFEKINKAYGAYRIRKSYSTNVIIGWFASTTLIVTLCAYPLLARFFFEENKTTEPMKTVVLQSYDLPAPPLGSLPRIKSEALSKKSEVNDRPSKPFPKEINLSEDQEIQEIGPDNGSVDLPGGTANNGNGGLVTEGAVSGKEGSTGESGKDFDPNKLYAKVYYLKIPPRHISEENGEIEFVYRADVERQIELYIKKGLVGRSVKLLGVTVKRTDEERIVNKDMWQISEGSGYVHKNEFQSFVKVNDLAAVNIINIQSIKKNVITLKDGTEIVLKNKFRDLLRQRLVFYTSAYNGDSLTLEGSASRKHFAYSVKSDSGSYASKTIGPLELSLGIADTKFISTTSALVTADLTGVNNRLNETLTEYRQNSEIVKLQKIIAERNAFDAKKREELLAFKFNRPYGNADRTLTIDDKMAGFRNVAEALAGGKVPGVIVSGNDIYIRSAGVMMVEDLNNPEQQIKRGGQSLGSGEDPLYLLDGQLSTKEVVLSLPISSVEVIDILTSADNTALYGSRGAYGVISVFTKKRG